MTDQKILSSDILVLEKLYLRYGGTDTSLGVLNDKLSNIIQTFEKAHRQRFGFVYPNRLLIIESISVEAIGSAEKLVDPEVNHIVRKDPQILNMTPSQEIKLWKNINHSIITGDIS